MTEAELNDAIKNCPWKKIVYDVAICRLEPIPCERVIDRGLCAMLIELFTEERRTDDER